MGRVDAIADRLAQSAAADRFAGAVLVRVGGATLLRAGYGLADREAGVPNRADTRFRIASAGKMFTGVATLRLVQDGALALDTQVGDLLPAYPDAATRGVTVDQLLTHSGGLDDFWGADFERHRDELRTPADYVARFGTLPLAAAPGAGFRYSSLGYVLLGRMLELAAGMDWQTLLEQLVFAPAGMTATGAPPESAAVPDRARAYRWEGVAWRDAAVTLPWRGTPAGGGLSTVDDLARFAAALADDRLLDARHRALLVERHVMVPTGGWYGYGFQLDERTVGHRGGAPGMAAIVALMPGKDALVVVLANRDGPAADRVATLLLDTLAAG